MHDGANNSRKVIHLLMVAGGTGGHIFPALAVAEELRRRSAQGAACSPQYAIEFLGTQRPLEARLIPAAGFALHAVPAAGLKGLGAVHTLQNFLVLPRTALAAARVLKEFRPRVVVGVGGYVAGPVMLEAALCGIPTLLVEPNARPGFTNRVLGPVVRAAAVGFKEAADFYGEKAYLTGHPVRRAFFEIPPKQPSARFTVLIVGGSQGSRAINRATVASLPLLAPLGNRIRIIHQTGEPDYNEVRTAYQSQGPLGEVHAFIEDMAAELAQADLVISRAGATAVAELAAAGRPALLVPFPAATDQHQLENARAMERAGAARVIVQKELTPERLVAEIQGLAADPERLRRMGSQARTLARPDAAARIADLIEGFARK